MIDSIRIETARLVLRPPRMEDFEGWAGLLADAEAVRYMGGVQPRAMAWRSFIGMVGAWHLQGFSMFSIVEKQSGRWVGRAGPWFPVDWPGPEVGWALLRDCWGRGYAAEAATAAIDWAFDTLDWDEVVHSIDPGNQPSRRLAARLGSTLRGPCRLPPPHADAPCELWGQTRAEWRRRRTG